MRPIRQNGKSQIRGTQMRDSRIKSVGKASILRRHMDHENRKQRTTSNLTNGAPQNKTQTYPMLVLGLPGQLAIKTGAGFAPEEPLSPLLEPNALQRSSPGPRPRLELSLSMRGPTASHMEVLNEGPFSLLFRALHWNSPEIWSLNAPWLYSPLAPLQMCSKGLQAWSLANSQSRNSVYLED